MASTTLAAQTGFAAKSHQLLLGKEAALAAVCTTIIIRLSCYVGRISTTGVPHLCLICGRVSLSDCSTHCPFRGNPTIPHAFVGVSLADFRTLLNLRVFGSLSHTPHEGALLDWDGIDFRVFKQLLNAGEHSRRLKPTVVKGGEEARYKTITWEYLLTSFQQLNEFFNFTPFGGFKSYKLGSQVGKFAFLHPHIKLQHFTNKNTGKYKLAIYFSWGVVNSSGVVCWSVGYEQVKTSHPYNLWDNWARDSLPNLISKHTSWPTPQLGATNFHPASETAPARSGSAAASSTAAQPKTKRKKRQRTATDSSATHPLYGGKQRQQHTSPSTSNNGAAVRSATRPAAATQPASPASSIVSEAE
jgi:hypothetical protein